MRPCSVVLTTRAANVMRPSVTTATDSNWTPTGTCQPNQVACSAADSDGWSRVEWRIGWTT
jgi:hypothetical protein